MSCKSYFYEAKGCSGGKKNGKIEDIVCPKKNREVFLNFVLNGFHKQNLCIEYGGRWRFGFYRTQTIKYTKQCFNKMDYQLILRYPSLPSSFEPSRTLRPFSPRWMDGQLITHHKFRPIFIPQNCVSMGLFC